MRRTPPGRQSTMTTTSSSCAKTRSRPTSRTTRSRCGGRRATGGSSRLGAVVGAIVALILTFAFNGQPASPELGLQFDKGQVFGFLLLLCGVIGAALGAVVALLIDRATARRAKSVVAEHSSTHHIDE